MRAVVQRVTRAEVRVEGAVIGAIGPGLCVLVSAGKDDGRPDDETDAAWLVDKLANLRIFGDADGKMNLALTETRGGLLVISQFTLHGDARKGRRPSFMGALEPVAAAALVDRVVALARAAGIAEVATGRFGADMKVALENDGPVTILLDSRRLF